MFKNSVDSSNNTFAVTSADNTPVEDFVHVMEIDDVAEEEKALTAKITAKNEKIGLGASQNSTEFCVTVEARTLPEDDESLRAAVDIVVALDVSGK